MEEFTQYQILSALEEEKLYLTEILETENDWSERQTMQERISDINAYFAEFGLHESKPKTETTPAEVENHTINVRQEIQKSQKVSVAL